MPNAMVWLSLLAVGLPNLAFANQTTTAPACCDDDGGLDSADVAAIVLGIFFLLLIVGTAVICVLFYKGCLGRDPEEQATVMPLFPDIFTTPSSLRSLSYEAIANSKKTQQAMLENTSSEPIIYIADDIYHPPNSRPLPTNRVPTVPYPERTCPPPIKTHQRSGKLMNRSFPDRKRSRKHHIRRHTKIVRDIRPESPALPVRETVSEGQGEDIVVIPDTARSLNIITHYSAKSPYKEYTFLSKSNL